LNKENHKQAKEKLKTREHNETIERKEERKREKNKNKQKKKRSTVNSE